MSNEPSHILVVDDDKRLRELLRRYLSERGFRVTAAADAAEAWARLESLAFDLIVLDVMMPGQGGLEFTQLLRAKSQVPILMLTAMGEAVDRIEASSGVPTTTSPSPSSRASSCCASSASSPASPRPQRLPRSRGCASAIAPST